MSDDCTCVCVAPARREFGSGVLIEPAEWEQADDCPVHAYLLHCETCGTQAVVLETFEDQIGLEEQARPVVVTRLACGHEIVTPGRWNT